MKIAHIAFSYKEGGATIAAARLHEALLDAGVESRFFCVRQSLPGRHVVVVPQNRILRFLFKYATKITRNALKPFYKRAISLNFVSSGMARAIRAYDPDIVHIHWIFSETISWKELQSLDYPFVVTLHDLWFVNGLDPHPKFDRRFTEGFNKANSTFYERYLFAHKKAFVESKKVLFTAPSKWARGECEKSIIGRTKECYSISNIFNDKVFYFDAALRKAHAEFCLIFGCQHGTKNNMKGFDDIVASLKYLPKDVKDNLVIQVFGEASAPKVIEGVRIEFLGTIASADDLRIVYHQADCFAFPSRFETQGQTKFEALLCGLPVIAFNRSACAEGIVHQQNGYVAHDGDYEDFAKGIVWMYANFKRNGDNSEARKSISYVISQTFGVKAVLSAWLSVYKTATPPPPISI